MPADLTHLPMHNATLHKKRTGPFVLAKCGNRVRRGQIEKYDNRPGCVSCQSIQTVERRHDEAGMKLNWSDYKSTLGSLHVRFPGGFCIYVNTMDAEWQPTNRWRVWWGDKAKDKMPGLTDRKFSSRRAAMEAVERVFVSVAHFAHELCAIPNVKPNVDLVWRKDS